MGCVETVKTLSFPKPDLDKYLKIYTHLESTNPIPNPAIIVAGHPFNRPILISIFEGYASNIFNNVKIKWLGYLNLYILGPLSIYVGGHGAHQVI